MTINKSFISSFARATEKAAYGASLLCGKKDKIAADKAAVDYMRNAMNKINMRGEIVIGEGEMDEAPMLYIGELLGNNQGEPLDIAVDPLEGTNFVANNLPEALSVLAVTKKNNLFRAPDMYMEKIAIGKNLPQNLIDLDYGVKKNIKLLAEAKNVKTNKLTACILKRPRHDPIIKDLIEMDVKIDFIDDGDVTAAISVANTSSGVDIYLGIGGAPEGVLSAAALKCLGCQMQTRLFFQNEDEKFRARKLGISDLYLKYYIEDMIKDDVIFCATGVTDGSLVKGIKDLGDFFESQTLVLHESSKTNKILINKIKK